jgi:membrane protein involved in colicin uptake
MAGRWRSTRRSRCGSAAAAEAKRKAAAEAKRKAAAEAKRKAQETPVKDATDRTRSGSDPVTTFKVSRALYEANSESDADNDGIACERH